MFKNIFLTSLALSTFTVSNAFAAHFTDEALWQAAVVSYNLETFDSIAPGTSISTLPSLGVSFDTLNDGTFPTVQPYSSTGGLPKSGPHNLLNDDDFSLPGEGPYVIEPLNSSESIFGLGLWNVGGDDQLKLSFYDANGDLLEEVTSASGTGFFGIYNTTGAKTAVIDFVGGNGYAPIDNLQVAGTSEVPVPAAAWMFGSALLGLAGLKRKK